MKFHIRWPLLAAGILLMGSLAVAAPKSAPLKPAPPEVSTSEVNQIMNFLRQAQPGLYRKAVMLRKSDLKQFDSLIRSAAPNFRRLEYMRKYDPKLFHYTLTDLQLTRKSYSLAWQLKKHANAGKAAQLQTELRAVVTTQFNLRQTIRRHIINRLLKRVAVLKAQLTRRSKDKRTIIADRIKQLTGKQLHVNW